LSDSAGTTAVARPLGAETEADPALEPAVVKRIRPEVGRVWSG
jgi:hypothetical protein